MSRATIAAMEAGLGGATPLSTWLALAKALQLYLRFEFARDPRADLADAGHLALQELVIQLAQAAGWEVTFEAASRAWGVDRSIDVRLVNRRTRRIVIVECWNTFGDLGASARSSNAKMAQASEQAVTIAGDGEPFEVGLVWVVRDTRANRDLAGRYGHILDAWLPGSSLAWCDALTRGGPAPGNAGFVWADTAATRLFARRKRGGAR